MYIMYTHKIFQGFNMIGVPDNENWNYQLLAHHTRKTCKRLGPCLMQVKLSETQFCGIDESQYFEIL